MAGSDGERGFAANSMLPGEAKPQSAPVACPPSTLYSIEYDEQKIENATQHEARPRGMKCDLMADDRLGSSLQIMALTQTQPESTE
jgi:hypothetical protein